MEDKSPNQIIEELIGTKFVPNYLKKRHGVHYYSEDMTQDIYLSLLSKPEKLKELYSQGGINKVRAYTSGLIQRFLSPLGQGGQKYIRHYNNLDYSDVILSWIFDEKSHNKNENKY